MKTKKDFDAVKMMRQIRLKRHAEYKENPELREERLKAIRKNTQVKLKVSKTLCSYNLALWICEL